VEPKEPFNESTELKWERLAGFFWVAGHYGFPAPWPLPLQVRPGLRRLITPEAAGPSENPLARQILGQGRWPRI